MMDALLFGVREAVRGNVALGYGVPQCEICFDGEPPPRCGAIFVAIHPGRVSSESEENLDEYFQFFLTLTMRVTIPIDRVGDQLLCNKLAKRNGFNGRVESLRAFLHKNWNVVQLANQQISEIVQRGGNVYGFCESPCYKGVQQPHWVGGDWFKSMPDAQDVGIAAMLTFDRVRRIQPIGEFF